MEQLSTIIQVVGSLITLVILPLLLLRSKKKQADAEAEKTEADNITAYAAEWKELYEKKEKRVVELDAKIDHLYAEITKYRDAIRELSEKNSELAVQNWNSGNAINMVVLTASHQANINQINYKYEDID
jgi:ethanolamine utilization protein EutA (predicted chaperonin)